MNTPQQILLKDFEQYIVSHYPPLTTKINLGSQYQLPVGPEGMAILIEKIDWNIEYLNITQHKVGDKGLQLIIDDQLRRGEKGWTNMKQFASIKNNITSLGFANFNKLNWSNLESLHFTHNKIDHRAISILIQGNFHHLKKLMIQHNNIGVIGCEMLSRSNWPNLQKMYLNYNCITNDGLAFLTFAEWPKLKELNISNNKLDARGMVYLQRANWPQLQFLHMSRNYIGFVNQSILTDMGCIHISKIKTKQIKHFNLYGNSITLNGIRIILSAGIFMDNCFLELTKNMFTFWEIKPLLDEFHLFCNQFRDD